MPLDALCLSAVAAELRKTIVGSRVDKIQQPEKDVLLLSLRGPSGPCRLLLSGGVGSARVHLTAQSRENPAEPPMFCMLLRKHLGGARLTAVEQPGIERLLLLSFACLDEMGVPSEKKLAVEMLGRNANLVLLDGEGRILDCLRKVDAEQSALRQLLPGLFYELPPKQDKPSLFSATEADLAALLERADGEKPADAWLVHSFAGVSPLLARELCWRLSGEADSRLAALSAASLYAAVQAAAAKVAAGETTPLLLRRNGQPFELYCLPIGQYGAGVEAEVCPDFSTLLDAYFTERERRERQEQRSQALLKLVKNRRDRALRKLGLRREEQQATAEREQWRQWGDLIKANLYQMQRGAAELRALNFYDEAGGEARIPLDPKLSPQQNAAAYYKKYSKAKNAEKVLSGQIEEAERELDYLESVLEEIGRASGEKDLAEIRQELTGEGYLKAPGGKRKKGQSAQPQPLKYRSSEGLPIYVGKNNLQNDWLTLRFVDKNAVWLHAQKTHGSHVIACCTEADEATLREAAQLAAWYSKARDSGNVPVDYTRVRYVRKPAGEKPGKVIYVNYRTLYVTPSAALAEALRTK